uniref:Uncharacterized protein n=1 Tax=Glossina pallidipes TaxID=7398 RepID=A0A1B0A4G8_GLOPL
MRALASDLCISYVKSPCSEQQQLTEIFSLQEFRAFYSGTLSIERKKHCSSIQSKASFTDIISETSHLIICRRDCKEFASEERSCSMRSTRRANPTTCKSAFNKLLTVAAPMPELAPLHTANDLADTVTKFSRDRPSLKEREVIKSYQNSFIKNSQEQHGKQMFHLTHKKTN